MKKKLPKKTIVKSLKANYFSGSILSFCTLAASISINKDIQKMQFIVYLVILINLSTFIKEANKDHYYVSNLNELSILCSLTENIREINQWMGGDPNKNIKYELTYSELSKKSKIMDHSLVKLECLSSDTECLNCFCDSDSEHFSNFYDFNDNLSNFDHFDLADFEEINILNNVILNNLELFDNINILNNFNNIVHLIVHFISSFGKFNKVLNFVEFAVKIMNTYRNFNNTKVVNFPKKFINFVDINNFKEFYNFYDKYFFNNNSLISTSKFFTNFEDIDILMRFVDRRDLDNFNNDSNLNDSDVIEFYGFNEIHFNDSDVNEFYIFDDIHFINNSYNFHKIEWENIHVLNDSLFHIET